MAVTENMARAELSQMGLDGDSGGHIKPGEEGGHTANSSHAFQCQSPLGLRQDHKRGSAGLSTSLHDTVMWIPRSSRGQMELLRDRKPLSDIFLCSLSYLATHQRIPTFL